jgi:hypothetical protein
MLSPFNAPFGATDPLQNHLNRVAFQSEYDSTISKLVVHIQEHLITASMGYLRSLRRASDVGNYKRNGHIDLVKWARRLSPQIKQSP